MATRLRPPAATSLSSAADPLLATLAEALAPAEEAATWTDEALAAADETALLADEAAEATAETAVETAPAALDVIDSRAGFVVSDEIATPAAEVALSTRRRRGSCVISLCSLGWV
jgi:transcriptional regulator GlxA family with amidase domain